MISPFRFFLDVYRQRITATGGLGGTCVDLANEYLDRCYNLPHVWANAVDWQHVHLPGWGWTENTPRNFPPLDSLVVWGPAASVGIGDYGHIAIAIAADLTFAITFDQNWPEGSGCVYVEHTYDGVIGWHTPPPP